MQVVQVVQVVTGKTCRTCKTGKTQSRLFSLLILRLVFLSTQKANFVNAGIAPKSDGVEEGTALLLEPTPEFYKQEDEEKQKLSFVYLLNYIRPYSKYIFQLMLGMLTASIISLIFPFLTQALVDTGIGNSNIAFIVMVPGGTVNTEPQPDCKRTSQKLDKSSCDKPCQHLTYFRFPH